MPLSGGSSALVIYLLLLFIKEWSVGTYSFSLVVLVISLFGLFVPVYVAGREKGA